MPRTHLLFLQTGRTWSLEAELKSSDGADFDGFGSTVSLSGNRALVGAEADIGQHHSGAAYAFVFDGTTWTQEAKLVPTGGVNPMCRNCQHLLWAAENASGCSARLRPYCSS